MAKHNSSSNSESCSCSSTTPTWAYICTDPRSWTYKGEMVETPYLEKPKVALKVALKELKG